MAEAYEGYNSEDEGNGDSVAEAGPSRKRAREESNGGYHSTQQQSVGIVPSLFGIDARNDFTKTVGEFIMNVCRNQENVEIEIKLGTLTAPLSLEAKMPRRIRMPTMSETIMPPDYPLGPFISSMTRSQNQSLNALLNSATASSQQSPHPIRFFRAQQTDFFYDAGSRTTGKVRVSRDKKTGQILENGVIRKRRLGDLNVYCPKEHLDWRISASVEEPCEMPISAPTSERDKDRACYQHQLVQVDLTVVRSKDAEGRPGQQTYEIEVEILDIPTLLAEGDKEARGEPNVFDEVLLSCLDTARMLIRNVGG